MVALRGVKAVAGNDPRRWHATVAALHACVGLLAMALLVARGHGHGPALLVSLAFTAHPVHVDSVAWVSGIQDVWLGLTGLAAALAWETWRRRPSTGRLLLLAAAFAVALLSKEAALGLLLFAAGEALVGRPPGRPGGGPGGAGPAGAGGREPRLPGAAPARARRAGPAVAVLRPARAGAGLDSTGRARVPALDAAPARPGAAQSRAAGDSHIIDRGAVGAGPAGRRPGRGRAARPGAGRTGSRPCSGSRPGSCPVSTCGP